MNYVETTGQPRIACVINNKTISAILDTGAAISILAKPLCDRLKLACTNETIVHELKGVSGKTLNVLGYTCIAVTINNSTFQVKFVVVEGIKEDTLLLGLDFIKENRLKLDFENNTLTANIYDKCANFSTVQNETIKPFSTKPFSRKRYPPLFEEFRQTSRGKFVS